MNFLKSIFGGKQQPPQQSKPTNKKQQVEIPSDILEEMFVVCAKFVGDSQNGVDDDLKLKLYGAFKQVTIGDCNTDKPPLYDMVARSKWNAWDSLRGVSKQSAQKTYIILANQADPAIQSKMTAYLEGDQDLFYKSKKPEKFNMESTGFKKQVIQVDYSDTYSHPYFKRIEKNLPIPENEIDKQLLLINNLCPNASPLHFAIDKEREDLVEIFLNHLTVEQVLSLTDGEGTSILEYAQLLENQPIIDMVNKKLKG